MDRVEKPDLIALPWGNVDLSGVIKRELRINADFHRLPRIFTERKMKERTMFTPKKPQKQEPCGCFDARPRKRRGLLVLCFWALLFTACPPAVENAPEPPPEPPGEEIELSEQGYPKTLRGLVYIWFGGWGNRTITFDNETTCTFVDDLREYYNEPDNPDRVYTYTDNWTYSNETGRGNITGGFSPGRFQLMNSNKTMHFLSFSVYGHGADFTRREK
jgi:hypothetical protein